MRGTRKKGVSRRTGGYNWDVLYKRRLSIIGLMLVCVFKSNSGIFMKLGIPEIGANMSIIVMSSWLNVPLIELSIPLYLS